MASLRTVLTRLRRRVLLHRRGLAATGAGLAVLLLVQILRPAPPPTVDVWVAARDLPAGAVLSQGDVRRTAWPRALSPPGGGDPDGLLGRTLIVPLQRGQPLTRRAVLGRRALAGYPGRHAVAVRLTDPDVAGLLAAGDRIDLWFTDPRDAQGTRRVADDARVLAVPAADDGALGLGAGSGRVVVLAVREDAVDDVAAAAGSGFLSVAWSG